MIYMYTYICISEVESKKACVGLSRTLLDGTV